MFEIRLNIITKQRANCTFLFLCGVPNSNLHTESRSEQPGGGCKLGNSRHSSIIPHNSFQTTFLKTSKHLNDRSLKWSRHIKCEGVPNVSRTEETSTETSSHHGRIGYVSPKEASSLMKDGWILLDVRPPEETNIARIEGAVEIPLFLVDDEISVRNLFKQALAFGMGGWWVGGAHMRPNPDFINQVEEKINRTEIPGVIVVCQKGLRSLAACEQLARAGYSRIVWINGGLDTAKPGDIPTVDDADIRMAGVGGLSGMIGWTEVQQEQSNKPLAGLLSWFIIGGLGITIFYQLYSQVMQSH